MVFGASPLFDCPAKGQPLLSTSGGFVRLALTGAMPVPESDSGKHEKRYCCSGAETPHKLMAKIASAPRKAVG